MRDAEAVIVLQARMGSKRLPGKSLLEIEGRSLLAHGIRRLAAASIAPVVVATTTAPEDDAIEIEAERWGSIVVRGSPEDVLARYAQAATALGSRFVIRATADNPAVDVEAPRRVLRVLRFGGVDYVAERGLPYGSAVEAIRTEVLLDAARRASHQSDREHVTPYVRRAGSGYRTVEIDAPAGVSRPDHRFTVDTIQDLEYMRRVLARVRCDEEPAPLSAIIRAADDLAGSVEVA